MQRMSAMWQRDKNNHNLRSDDRVWTDYKIYIQEKKNIYINIVVI